MQNIVERWQSLPREDLFQFWKAELALKKELRNNLSQYRAIKLNHAVDYHFLRHSLAYGEHQELFYTILLLNMNCQPVQYAVINGPLEQYLDFLHFLPQLLSHEKPSPHALQFLINIYREDFHAYFIDIVQTLTEPDCDYLMERTANKKLRQLLKDRQLELGQQNNDANYDLLNTLNSLPKYPGIYGDKIPIIAQALTSISNKGFNNIMNVSDLKYLLETADLLYMTGLLDDCLSLLILVNRQQNQQATAFKQDENSLNIRSLSKILSKSLPIYFLLRCPLSAYQHCLNSYHIYFPTLPVDETALLYLDIYAVLLANYQGNPQYTMLEMTQHYIRKDHGESHILLDYLHNPDKLAGDALSKISQYAHENISILPHASFIIMEIIRWLERVDLIAITRNIANRLLGDYLQLFQWIPSPMFINTNIRNQLALSADEQLLNEVDQILKLRNLYSFTELRELYTIQTELFVNDCKTRQLLLGSFLGVF